MRRSNRAGCAGALHAAGRGLIREPHYGLPYNLAIHFRRTGEAHTHLPDASAGRTRVNPPGTPLRSRSTRR